MRFIRPHLLALALAAPLAALSGVTAAAQSEPRVYTLATANAGGTYYPVGVALALLTKINLASQYGIDMEAVVSGGSVDNISMMEAGRADFAFLQAVGMAAGAAAEVSAEAEETSDEATTEATSGAANAVQALTAGEDLRAVTMLWPDVAHFLLRADLAEAGTLADLQNLTGLGFSLGPAGSSTEQINALIFEALELPYQEWNPVNETYRDSVESLPEGRIAGVNIESGLGVGAVSNLMTAMGDSVVLLSVSDAELARISEVLRSAATVSIPGGTYAGMEEAVQSIAVPNFLAVHADVPEEDVYRITRVMFENLEYLCEVHQAACLLSLSMAQDGLPVPLHPGAARYFEEMADESDLIVEGDDDS
ncbi:TAXI family TRAP transporter solute-binding subunit [Pararhodobacter oceanensis]|uniref:TAXI family TRAP transporter solute-binding subunit n=1 Tax=Pararhodobacter oceanensis TaxID=2172121 RepID=UPI003A91C478